MKRAGVLLIAALMCLPAGAQSWSPIPGAPTAGGRHDDIRFSSRERGWLVNTRGDIWASRDGGVTWNRQLESKTHAFRAVAPLNDSTAFVGTIQSPGEVLFATFDGGDTWEDISDRLYGVDVAGICGMWPVDEKTVVGVGAFFGEPRIVRTEDGGETWTSRNFDFLIATLIDVAFTDELTGFATGGSSPGLDGVPVILKTTDGGNAWRRVYTGIKTPGVGGEWGWKISFPSPEVGYVSVEYAGNPERKLSKYLKTIDGGESWTAHRIEGSDTFAGLQGIGFISETTGWASGRGTTSMTTDGGATWRQLLPWRETFPGGQLDGSVNRIYVHSDSFAVAVGQRAYRLGGVATAVEGRPPADFTSSALLPPWPNPFTDGTTIAVNLAEAGRLRLQIIDVQGRVVSDLIDEDLGPGRHEVAWNGRAADGRRLASGLYMILADVGESREIKSVVRLR